MSKRTLFISLLMAALLSVIIILPSASIFAASATFTVTTIDDGADANPGDGICATAGAVCTLRAAIEEANANSGTDTVAFNIGTGVQTIKYTAMLPIVTDPIIIDGTTQPGYADKPLIVLDGSLVADPSDAFYQYGLHITAGASTVKGLAIIKFGGTAVFFEDGGTNIIQANYIGVNAAGTSGAGNKNDGIRVDNASGTQILDNVISDNTSSGITVYDSSNLIIQGNIIGLTAAGTNPLGNGSDGIYITTWDANSADITIGGSAAGQGNIISSNTRDGIRLSGSAEKTENLVIQGNRIGTDLAGNLDRGNKGVGMYLYDALDVTIGGAAAGEGNLISGNDDDGISISAGDGITIYGNLIGTNAAGNAPLGNGDSGINMFNAPTQVLIGGATAGMGNIISANAWSGIYLFSTSNVMIQGNFIGTNPAGGALGNLKDGIYIDTESDSNVIGGVAAGEANWIAYNNLAGVRVYGQANVIRGNAFANNTLVGIDLRIGGVSDSLSSPNVSENDFGDGDTGGNNLQNFPVITSAAVNGANLDIAGTLASSYVTTFVIDFYINGSCDVAGNGEAGMYIGSVENVNTDNDGNASFTASVPVPAAGTIVTATATDSGNNTSEFSACFTMTGLPPANTAPVVTNPGAQNSVEGAVVNMQIAATDGENDTLTYGAVNLPTGLTVNATTGVISGTIAAGAAGNSPFNVMISASDGKVASEQSFAWTVTVKQIDPNNQAPVVTNPGPRSSVEGVTISYQIAATDADGDTLSYVASFLPLGLEINPNSGLISGTIAAGAINNSPYNVSVSVSDGSAISTINFTWTIFGNTQDSMIRLNPINGKVITNESLYASKFQWSAQDGAEWYHVYVANAEYTLLFLDAWYQAGDVCEGTICTALDDIWLTGNGDYVWWMTYWSPAVGDAYVDLYNSSTFSVNMAQPGTVTGGLPAGNLTGTQVTLKWNVEPNSLWYQVWTGPADYSTSYYFNWVNAAEICTGGVCTLEIPGTAAAGAHETWIQAWGPIGMTEWQLLAEYTVIP